MSEDDEDILWELRCKIRDLLGAPPVLISLSALKLGVAADAIIQLLEDEGVFRKYPVAEIIVSGLVLIHGNPMSIQEIESAIPRN